MKINEHEGITTSDLYTTPEANTTPAVIAPRVLLVPYCSHHVPTYHQWMQDEEIQKATASDPLTLPEEHSMQESWRLDHDKLTFILCHSPSPSSASSPTTITPELHDAPEKMIGDVNLFIYEDEDEDEVSGEVQGANPVIGEIEIMIAEHSARRMGLAREALGAFMSYIVSKSEAILEEYRQGCDERSERYMKYLRVKIDKDNAASLALFGKIGFKQVGEVNYFGEVEMRMEWEEVIKLEQDTGKVVGYGS
jgi:RimJ/RimL family protein N-acetyltransferase